MYDYFYTAPDLLYHVVMFLNAVITGVLIRKIITCEWAENLDGLKIFADLIVAVLVFMLLFETIYYIIGKLVFGLIIIDLVVLKVVLLKTWTSGTRAMEKWLSQGGTEHADIEECLNNNDVARAKKLLAQHKIHFTCVPTNHKPA